MVHRYTLQFCLFLWTIGGRLGTDSSNIRKANKMFCRREWKLSRQWQNRTALRNSWVLSPWPRAIFWPNSGMLRNSEPDSAHYTNLKIHAVSIICHQCSIQTGAARDHFSILPATFVSINKCEWSYCWIVIDTRRLNRRVGWSELGVSNTLHLVNWGRHSEGLFKTCRAKAKSI